MDLKEPIVLVGEEGTIKLPLENLLRITLVKLQVLYQEYLELAVGAEKPSTVGFFEWLRERLGAKGKNILL